MLAPGVKGCTEFEEYPADLQGDWIITWQAGNDFLEGEISFHDSTARLIAFGSAKSAFLSKPEEAVFRYRLRENYLILERTDSPVILEYEIVEKLTNHVEMRYSDEVLVVLHRKNS